MSNPYPLRKLSPDQVKHIQKQYKIFLKVERVTGVPWQAVASLWYRESFSVAPPSRPGGQFQFDPPHPPPDRIHDLLSKYTKLNYHERQLCVERGVEHFPTAALLAACHLRDHCHQVLSLESSDEDIKDAFYGYNGRKYGSADHSPYVMNGYDEQHLDMRVRGTVREPDGSNKWVDVIDSNMGAFCVYKHLCELFPKHVPEPEEVPYDHVSVKPEDAPATGTLHQRASTDRDLSYTTIAEITGTTNLNLSQPVETLD